MRIGDTGPADPERRGATMLLQMGSSRGAVTSADTIRPLPNSQFSTLNSPLITFYHRNPEETVFDVAVSQQGMDTVKSRLMNPLKNLTFGGCLSGENLEYAGISDAVYAGTDYRARNFRSSKVSRKQHFSLYCIQIRRRQKNSGYKTYKSV